MPNPAPTDQTITLDGHPLRTDQLVAVARENAKVGLHPSARASMEAARAVVDAATADGLPHYGINTGFGSLSRTRISPQHLRDLQRNLVRSHAAGVGPLLPVEVVRATMLLLAASLSRGLSGVRPIVVDRILELLNHQITPAVPEVGSVGASGDLAPLAHMTAVLIGAGFAEYKGDILPGAEALAKAGLKPIPLGPKEGLAFINGTQFSTAFGLSGLFEAWRAAQAALVTSAMSTDAIMGSTAPLQPEIHSLRGHPGQIEAAAFLRALLDGSVIRESHREGDTRVQDPYCIRCQPQVTGAAMDVLRMAARTLEVEANAATDNPLVLTEAGMIVSGGNFHAEPVGFAADMIALAISEIGAIAQRRVALMVDPVLSFDLPAFLTPAPGLNSGYMIAEVTTAALMSENKHLATPCVTDSTPTSANQEDHVSMAAHGARRLMQMNGNLARILGIELLCAAQGVEFRAPLPTSTPLQKAIARLRRDVPALADDRYIAPDLETAATLVKSGAIAVATGLALPDFAA